MAETGCHEIRTPAFVQERNWTAMSGRAIQKLSKPLKMRNRVFLPTGHGMNPAFVQSLRF
jgi:hypothetical protein